MESVITVLSEIESKAERILTNTGKSKKILEEESQQRIKREKRAIENDLATQLDTIKKQCASDIAKRTAVIELESAKKIQHLEENYDKNAAVIVDELFHKIIEV